MTYEAERYEIRVRGHLDQHWTTWLGTAELDHNRDGTSTLRTTPIDQAQLHGLLAQLRDIGATMTWLQTIDEPEAGNASTSQHTP